MVEFSALPLESPIFHRCSVCGQTQFTGLRFESSKGGFLCDACAEKSNNRTTKINEWLDEVMELEFYDSEVHIPAGFRKYPALGHHVLRKRDCGYQGSWKVCSNPACGKVHFFNGACGSIICKRCGGILTDRLKKSLAHDLAPCPHHYGVFTLPPELHTGTWADITLLFKVISKTFYEILGPIKKRKGIYVNYWGAWCSPHAYSSTDLSWHPHINVICTTHHDIAGHIYQARKLFDYARVRKAFFKTLKEVSGAKLKGRKWQDLQVKFELITKPEEIIQNLVGYSVSPPLPNKISLQGGMVAYRVPHGSRKNPPQKESVDSFLTKLNALVPPKHFRAIRRWGIYNARHELYKNKPFVPVDTSPLEFAECSCCGESLAFVAVQGATRIIHIGGESCRKLDSNGFRSAYELFIHGLCRCRNELAAPPPPSFWLERLTQAHNDSCECHKAHLLDTRENLSRNFKKVISEPPLDDSSADKLWEYFKSLRLHLKFGTVPDDYSGARDSSDVLKLLLATRARLLTHPDFKLINSESTGDSILVREPKGGVSNG